MEKSSQTVIFLHIPKTAGSTFSGIISRQYESNNIAAFYPKGSDALKEFNKFKEDTKNRRERIKCLAGHICMGWRCHEMFPQPSTYITFLRDPINRVISLYHFILQTPRHYHHNILKSKGMSLEEFVSSGMTSEIDNGQTRALACNGSDLEGAKENIKDKFTVVGFTEQFDETLMLLKRIFGWENLFYMHENVTNSRARKEEVSKDILDIIKNNNKLDLKLYRFAKERFEELIRKQGDSFQQELRTFQLQNKVWQEQKIIIKQQKQILNEKNQQINTQKQIANTLYNSLSWRITKPLRKIRKLFQRKMNRTK